MAPEKKSPAPRNSNDQQEPKGPGGSFFSRGWFWIILAILILFGSRYFLSPSSDTSDTVGLNRVAQLIQEDKISKIVVQ
ncbi:MAG: hypothetical protein R2867_22015 [Caldilineaceae bacterium]